MLKIDQLSFWERTNYFEQIDFLIIGSGIVGCTTALELRKKFKEAKIVILEAGYLPSGASSKNAGFACFGSPTELLDDLSHISETEVWDTVALRYEGLKKLQEHVSPGILDLQINGSWDLLTESEETTTQAVRDQLSYLNQKIYEITGQKNVYSEDSETLEKFGFKGWKTSFFNRLEGQINTGHLIQALHRELAVKSIHLITGIKVLEIDPINGSCETEIGQIKSNKLVVATNGFARQLLNLPVKPARAQVLVTSPIPNLSIKGTFHFQSGYYYFRNFENRILFGGGRNLDFDKETTTDLEISDRIQTHLQSILQHQIIPGIDHKIDYQWAGIMGVGDSKKPIVQQISNNTVVAVRMGGMGVAIGSEIGILAASLLSD